MKKSRWLFIKSCVRTYVRTYFWDIQEMSGKLLWGTSLFLIINNKIWSVLRKAKFIFWIVLIFDWRTNQEHFKINLYFFICFSVLNFKYITLKLRLLISWNSDLQISNFTVSSIFEPLNNVELYTIKFFR